MGLKGELHGRHILTEKQVKWIRENCKPGAGTGQRGGVLHNGGVRERHTELSMSSVAEEVGVSPKQVKRVLTHENWGHC